MRRPRRHVLIVSASRPSSVIGADISETSARVLDDEPFVLVGETDKLLRIQRHLAPMTSEQVAATTLGELAQVAEHVEPDDEGRRMYRVSPRRYRHR